MSDKHDVGEISFSSKGVHWTIPNFSQLPQIHDTVIESSSFQFENRGWRLWIYPNGHRRHSSLDWFGISAFPFVPLTPIECDIHICIADEQGRSIVSSRAQRDGRFIYVYRCMKLISYAEFISRKNEFMPNGTLHILFTIVMKEPQSTFHADVNKVEDGKKKCDHASNDVSTRTEEGVGKESKKKLNNELKDVSTQTEEEVEVSKVKQDLERMLLNENLTDLVLTVHGQEFRTHRSILAARSPVFLAMLTHDTKEKATGVVDIEDGDPNTVPDFLRFLYTENVNNFTSEKALKLYYIADKYQVCDLKQKCKDQLLTNISVENFCDVITLSLQHNETQLKDACIQFFQENSLDIVMTAKWQTFLSENPIIGNELFIKHLQLIKSHYCKK